MSTLRSRIPVPLLIVALGVFVAGLLANWALPALAGSEALAENVLLNAIPFVLIFVSILLVFIALIVFASRSLSNTISARLYGQVEVVLTVGIVAGVVGMFQPWFFGLYRIGFLLLLVSILSYILWTHILPARAHRQAGTERS